MKDTLRTFLLKCASSLPLPLALTPVLLVAGSYFIPGEPFLWILPGLVGYGWAMLCFFLRGRFRGLGAMLGLLPLTLLGLWRYAPYGLGVIIPLLCAAVIMLVLPTVFSAPLWDEWPFGLWIAGVALQLLGQIFTSYPPYSAASGIMGLSFAAYMLLFFLSLNAQSLRTSNHGQEKSQSSIRKRNRFMTLLLFLPALIAACWGTIGQALTQAWETIRVWLANLLARLLFAPDDGSGSGGGMGGDMDFSGLGGEAAETGAFWKILEKIMTVIAFLILAAAVFFVLRFLWRKLKLLIPKLLQKLHAYQDAAGEDYVDEAESTLDWDERSQEIKRKILNVFRRGPGKKPWEQLDGPARVRRLYQQWAERHQPGAAKTAREALLEGSGENAREFADLYDAARYGEKQVSGDAADQMRRQIKNLR